MKILGLVSKETVVLRRWGRKTQAFNLFTVSNRHVHYQLS